MQMNEDISRKAVVVLVFIAVAVSILSTSIVLNTVHSFAPARAEAPATPTSTAKATLVVPGTPENPIASGEVSLTVK
jgi:hypothetical protein